MRFSRVQVYTQPWNKYLFFLIVLPKSIFIILVALSVFFLLYRFYFNVLNIIAFSRSRKCNFFSLPLHLLNIR